MVLVPSTFPPDKAPITFPLNAYLGKAYLHPDNRASLMTVVHEIERIARLHKDTKGVIHFPSYEWYTMINAFLAPDVKERSFVHTSSTRNEKLSEFRDSPPSTILFAIKMEEGTDFRDDQARWQIIVKTPYQDIGDEWVSRHKERMG